MDQVADIVDTGIDYVGIVFAPESPRARTLPEAAELAMEARVAGFTGGIVGVFVNPTLAHVRAVVQGVELDVLQLHGEENAEFVSEVARLRPVWKAVRVRPGVTAAALARTARAYPGVDAILLDGFDPDRRGGTGRAFDPDVAREVVAERPVVWAGGLTAETVAARLGSVRPFAVDVSSGVESAPGVKDVAKLQAFVASVHALDEGRP